MGPLIRWFFETLVKLYYPGITIEGRERVPFTGPALFVLNHPNALLDPLVLRVALGRPVRFLGKSTLFANPVSRAAMEAFGAIPVYRQRDVAEGGADTSNNERTFALCRAALGRGESLALFPEGTSHSDPELRPFKTGAARIALSAQVEHGEGFHLAILPVGLYYDRKVVFRSRALATVGEPIDVGAWVARYKDDEREAVKGLTEAIRDAIDAVVLQADTRDLLEGVARVALWTADPRLRDDLAEQQRRARELLGRYEALRRADPERAERVVSLAAQYTRVLRALGVDDPWALEVAPVRPAAAFAAFARLAALAPLALAGVALGWAPYRLAGRVAGRVVHEEDALSTAKLIGGALFVLVAWIVEAALLGWRFGPWAALAVAVLGPVGGYAALRFEEGLAVVSEASRHGWLRARHPDVAAAVAERRRGLANEVAEALRATDGPTGAPPVDARRH